MADARFAPRGAAQYESDAIDIARIVVVAVAIIAIVAGCVIASALLERAFARGFGRAIPAPANTRPPAISGPVLQVSPETELDALRAAKRAQLEDYRWIDRQKGVVQISIERAMQLLAERAAAKDASP